MKRLLLLFVLITSCIKSKEYSQYPLVVSKDCDSIISENSNVMLPSKPVVYGINFKDSLNLNIKVDYKSSNYNDFVQNTTYHDSIEIFVDNNKSDFHTVEFNTLNFPPPPPPKMKDSVFNNITKTYEHVYDIALVNKQYDEAIKNIEKRKKLHYQTFPVYIYNYGFRETVIQKPIAEDVFVLLEAKDKNGIWKPIEYITQYSFLCGTGHQDYILKPKHYMLTAVKKYEGDYKTKLRVKFKNFSKVYYSNEYAGYINYNQFNSKDIISQTNKKLQHKDSLTLIRKQKGLFLNE